ncbi:hypothetical protein IEN85_10755 [Pelagicoccus sp. NFK12]|uniref:Uncharacterized protein n=1 Tax=Pelagicoccus enzymogenes TaxID=2773457 RepID=A0A927IHR1_9BACT|nr:hypothetical protein [Pelagicoccus enzymogenes]MBD5779968.1 hypothetical protein [Pelagicoccus enzymogenes]
MKTQSNSLLLALPLLLLSFGCSQKPEEAVIVDIEPDLTEERFSELESRILELESQISQLDEKLLATNLRIDKASLIATTKAITNRPDPTHSKIKEFIESGSFTVKDDTVYYTGDIILNFGPKLKITSVDGKLLSDLNQTVFGGDMIVETAAKGGTIFLRITDGYLERHGEKVHVESEKPGTFKMEYLSNQAAHTTPAFAPL